jgi:hypothetical protein
MAKQMAGQMGIPAGEMEDKQYVDSAGRPSETAPGPRGARMAQLGLLTRAQKKKPVMPQIRTNADGQPHPGDMEQFKFASTLAQQAKTQQMQALQTGPQNGLAERDPMKTSLFRQARMMKR